jgi:hypothetical protein
VIGHLKAEGHLGRYYLKGRAGDAANVILTAVGYNLRLVLAWLRIILRVILLALLQTFTFGQPLNRRLNGRLIPLAKRSRMRIAPLGQYDDNQAYQSDEFLARRPSASLPSCLVGLNRNLAFRLIVPREGGLMPTPKGHSGA